MDKTIIDGLLTEIERRNKTILWNKDVQGIAGIKDEFMLDSIRLAVFNRRFSNPVDDLPPISILFGVLVSAQRLGKNSPPEIRLYIKCAMLCLVHTMRFLGGYRESDEKVTRYRQAFYDRIEDLDQNNIFREVFIKEYNCDSLYGEEIEERLMEDVLDEYKKTISPCERHSDEVCNNAGNEESANNDFVKAVLAEWHRQFLLSVTNYQNKKGYEALWRIGEKTPPTMSAVNAFYTKIKCYYEAFKKRIRRNK